MAEEEKQDKTEEQPAEEQAPEAEAPAEEAPKEEAPAEDAPKEDAPEEAAPESGEAPKEDEPPAAADAEEASSDEAEDASSDDAGPDEMEGLDWKARKRLVRSRESGAAAPQQSPEDRAKARAERRGKAAKTRSSYRRKRREKHEAGQGTPPAESRSAGRKVRQGRVVSDKPDKTITVEIDVARRHPTYEKIVRQSNTLHAHDERNEATQGDLVRVVETRPLSRTKRWRLVEILEKAE
jgi:small subunit ribosomal protein S17